MAATTQDNANKEIDKGIAGLYLGLGDISDLDFQTYKTLLRERIAAARMGDSSMDSGDVEVLTKEFVRIKKIDVIDAQPKKKIDTEKFVNKVKKEQKEQVRQEKTAAKKIFATVDSSPAQKQIKKISPKALLPAAKPEVEQDEQMPEGLDDLLNDIRSEQTEAVTSIVPTLDTFQKTMDSINETLNKQYLLDKKEKTEEDALQKKQKRTAREKLLETDKRATGKEDKNIAKKVVKPVKGIFDTLLDFFKNILLGGALLFLLNLLKDPAKVLQPLVDALNRVIEFLNGIIRAINDFTNEFNYFVIKPINDFLITPIHSSMSFLEDRVNDLINLIPPPFRPELLENVPDQAPTIPDIPDIPEMDLYDPFKVLPENQTPPAVQQTYQGGEVRLSNENINNVQMFEQGGNVTNNTGINITGAGSDTQLIAAQPGEIVMSRGAVSKFGASNLLAMNAAGGGNNSPRMTNNIQLANGGGTVINAEAFSGGGLVGGTAGSPSDPKNRKIYLHWTGAGGNQNVGPYHQVFNKSGKPMRTANYGIDNNEGTMKANFNSITLAAAALGHGPPAEPYSDARGWAENPLTGAQTTAMAKEAAGLLSAYGQTASDVDKNVMTHGEIDRQFMREGKLSKPGQRWDLDSLTPGPYNHPGGFFSTQQVRSRGGNAMRSKIKSFLGGGGGGGESAETPKMSMKLERPDGMKEQHFQMFGSMTADHRAELAAATIGEKVDGLTVTQEIRAEVKRYNIALSKHTQMMANPQEVGSGRAVASTATISTTGVTRTAPAAPTPNNLIAELGQPNSIAPGATPASTAAGGAGQVVPNFSSVDGMNMEMLVIKSIYNLVG